jgi:hypothetical protein
MLKAYLQSNKLCIYIHHKAITIRVERIMRLLSSQSNDKSDMFGWTFDDIIPFEKAKTYLVDQGYVLEDMKE